MQQLKIEDKSVIFKTFATSKVVHLTLMEDVPSGAILN